MSIRFKILKFSFTDMWSTIANISIVALCSISGIFLRGYGNNGIFEISPLSSIGVHSEFVSKEIEKGTLEKLF